MRHVSYDFLRARIIIAGNYFARVGGENTNFDPCFGRFGKRSSARARREANCARSELKLSRWKGDLPTEYRQLTDVFICGRLSGCRGFAYVGSRQGPRLFRSISGGRKRKKSVEIGRDSGRVAGAKRSADFNFKAMEHLVTSKDWNM